MRKSSIALLTSALCWMLLGRIGYVWHITFELLSVVSLIFFIRDCVKTEAPKEIETPDKDELFEKIKELRNEL